VFDVGVFVWQVVDVMKTVPSMVSGTAGALDRTTVRSVSRLYYKLCQKCKQTIIINCQKWMRTILID